MSDQFLDLLAEGVVWRRAPCYDEEDPGDTYILTGAKKHPWLYRELMGWRQKREVTLKDAAGMMGVTKNALWKRIKRTRQKVGDSPDHVQFGDLDAHKVGGRWLVDLWEPPSPGERSSPAIELESGPLVLLRRIARFEAERSRDNKSHRLMIL